MELRGTRHITAFGDCSLFLVIMLFFRLSDLIVIIIKASRLRVIIITLDYRLRLSRHLTVLILMDFNPKNFASLEMSEPLSYI